MASPKHGRQHVMRRSRTSDLFRLLTAAVLALSVLTGFAPDLHPHQSRLDRFAHFISLKGEDVLLAGLRTYVLLSYYSG